jgi:hypothetical protein
MPRQDIISEVSAENVRRHVEHITTAIPSRLAGSPNARRMAEYSLQALRDAGAEARIQELPGLVSFPKKAELRIVATRETKCRCFRASASPNRRTAAAVNAEGRSRPSMVPRECRECWRPVQITLGEFNHPAPTNSCWSEATRIPGRAVPTAESLRAVECTRTFSIRQALPMRRSGTC